MPQHPGYRRCVPWSEKEIETLHRFYGSISVKDMVGLLPGRTYKAIKRQAFLLGLRFSEEQLRSVHRKYSCEESYFSIPNNENSYWAGFIAADGCIGSSKNYLCVALSRKDRDHLEKFSSAVSYTGPICDYFDRKTPMSECYDCSILSICCSKKILSDLEANYNVGPRKTYNLKRPSGLDDNQSLSYVAGLIDGDGSIYYNHASAPVLSITGTFDVVSWSKDVVENALKTSTNNKMRQRSEHLFEFQMAGRKINLLEEKVRELDIPLMERKWEKASAATPRI